MDKSQLIELKNKFAEFKNTGLNNNYQRIIINEAIKANTGYATVDKPWMKYYSPDGEQIVSNIPVNKTIWDVVEDSFEDYSEYPAIEYFGKSISREDFRNMVYTWARTFRAMGIEEDEVVPIYGPFMPDICAMVFSLIMIGACPYFLKLEISPEALAQETAKSRTAIVYDGMWNNVACEFTKEKYKTIIVASITENMPNPKKEIISFLSKMKAIKNKSKIPKEKKYVWFDDAREIGNYYIGDVKVAFKPNRNTIISSSSGTSLNGVVKGCVSTNESILTQLCMGDAADIQFFPGDRCLNHLPPTASTSLNLLFFIPLYRGMTVVLEPRTSIDAWYNALVNLKPNACLNTGSTWNLFFKRVKEEMNRGKKFDFSYGDVWVVGGEGTDVKKFLTWDEIMRMAGNNRGVVSAYGQSEFFSAVCSEKYNARCSFDKKVMGVGIPYAGLTVGVFDENGKELKYNHRGNLWIKGDAMMKEYYGKPELTEKTIGDGWLKTGDMAEIDEDGFVYIWGRLSDKFDLEDGSKIYLFDIANHLKDNDFIEEVIVVPKPTTDNKYSIAVHLALSNNQENVEDCIRIIDKQLKQYLPGCVSVGGYSVHGDALPYSPATLKIAVKSMAKQLDNYSAIENDEFVKVSYSLLENGLFERNVIKNSVLKLK